MKIAEGKINLKYLTAYVLMDVRGLDTVATQITNVYSGDMVAAILAHQVSNDGINWIDTDDDTTTTAAGTQSYMTDVINVQGWPWYRFAVKTAASTDKWVRITLRGKKNT